MARSRNIKPSFFVNVELGELDPMARLLFIGMWTVADFKGDFEWQPKRLKIQILPYDNCDITELAISLDKSRLITFYSDGEKIYCRVVNFREHQNPHPNEEKKGSSIPKYSEAMRQLVDISTLTINRDKSRQVSEDSISDPADSLIPLTDSLILIPDTNQPASQQVQASAVDNLRVVSIMQDKSQQTPDDAFPMTMDWIPSADWILALSDTQLRGGSKADWQGQLTEFIWYRMRNRPNQQLNQAGWEHAFLGTLMFNQNENDAAMR